MDPVAAWFDETCLQAVENKRQAGGDALGVSADRWRADNASTMHTCLVLLPCAKRISGVVQKSCRYPVCTIGSRSDKADHLPVQGVKQRLETPLVKTVNVSPRWVGLATTLAGRTAATEILPVRNADHHLILGDAGNFAASLRQQMLGNVFKDLGAKDCIELVVFEGQAGDAPRYRIDGRMVDLGFFEIQCDDSFKALGQHFSQVTVAGPDIEGADTHSRKEYEEVGDTLTLSGAGAIFGQVGRHLYSSIAHEVKNTGIRFGDSIWLSAIARLLCSMLVGVDQCQGVQE